MRVFEVMTEGAQTVSPSMPAPEAFELMRRNRIHHLVVAEGSNVIGVLSDRDIGSRPGSSVRAGRTVADLMTAHAVTVGPADTIRRAANLMRGRTIGCVPVVDGKRLVGILTVSDLLELLGRGIERPAKKLRRTSPRRPPSASSRRPGGAR
jgi:acetoin utilization protein AcuB